MQLRDLSNLPDTNRKQLLYNQSQQNKQIRYQNVNILKIKVSLLCLSTFYFGYCLTYVSTLTSEMMLSLFGPLTQRPEVKGFLIGILTLGAAVGAFCSPFFMKCLSRRNLILSINIMALIFQGIIQYQNIYCLLVCRAFQGFFIGNFMAIVPIYINQLSPKQIVGTFGVYTQLFVVIGVVFSFLMGIILLKAGVEGAIMWRIMFILNTITLGTSTICILMKIIPESPNSLIMNDQIEEAKQVISLFFKEQYVNQVLRQKILQVEHEKSNNHEQGQSQKSLCYSKKAYLIGFELPFMQQLTGINAIVTQIGSIMTQHNPSFGYYSPFILNFIQLIATVFAIYAILAFGRRPILLFGNVALAICDIALGVLFLFIKDSQAIIWIVFVILIIYMIVYGVTLGPTVWLYCPEIIPAKVVPFATTLNWIGCSISIIILPILNQHTGEQTVFFIFGGITLLTFLINYFNLIETKGLTLAQICKAHQ